jgi:hypothetical protein
MKKLDAVTSETADLPLRRRTCEMGFFASKIWIFLPPAGSPPGAGCRPGSL